MEYTFWMFQVVFAATAATIVSGAMAERTKFSGYLAYSLVITAVIYPVFGHWAWGNLLIGDNSGAWLAGMGFNDFAGSTVVHSVGGWAALAGAIVVGPRLGKFGKDGKPRAIPGHNMPMATLGVFILFMGWFGFNAGSTTTADGTVARIAVNTFLAACAGGMAAMLASWAKFGKSDVGMTLNGVLAGLVGITAGCATTTPLGSIVIGLIAGVLVMYSVLFFDSIKIDDPVGAISVHGICGVWGTLAAGLLHEDLLSGADYDLMGAMFAQVVGIVTAFVWTFGTAFILFKIVSATIGLRVSEQEEIEGLIWASTARQPIPTSWWRGAPAAIPRRRPRRPCTLDEPVGRRRALRRRLTSATAFPFLQTPHVQPCSAPNYAEQGCRGSGCRDSGPRPRRRAHIGRPQMLRPANAQGAARMG